MTGQQKPEIHWQDNWTNDCWIDGQQERHIVRYNYKWLTDDCIAVQCSGSILKESFNAAMCRCVCMFVVYECKLKMSWSLVEMMLYTPASDACKYKWLTDYTCVCLFAHMYGFLILLFVRLFSSMDGWMDEWLNEWLMFVWLVIYLATRTK